MLAPDPRFDAIDSLDGRAFEEAVGQLLEILGFDDVQRIGGFDKGADLVAVRDGVRTAVQAKRWSKAVGITAVRQLVDGMKRYDCTAGICVTNNFFTQPAIECAETWGVELWDRWRLAEYVDGDEPEVDRTVCAECGVHVTRGVTDWCLKHPARYGGNVFCVKHQDSRNRRAP